MTVKKHYDKINNITITVIFSGGGKMSYSDSWKNWETVKDDKTCKICKENNGKIYKLNEIPIPKPPVHVYCRCKIVKLRTVLAGNASIMGKYGADWCIKYYGRLPGYYIDKATAKKMGWSGLKGNLSKIAPGCMIGGEVFKNLSGKLPYKHGRIWYEADLNYLNGYRNSDRVLYSNDGLIFVTYDHYESFIEVV